MALGHLTSSQPFGSCDGPSVISFHTSVVGSTNYKLKKTCPDFTTCFLSLGKRSQCNQKPLNIIYFVLIWILPFRLSQGDPSVPDFTYSVFSLVSVTETLNHRLTLTSLTHDVSARARGSSSLIRWGYTVRADVRSLRRHRTARHIWAVANKFKHKSPVLSFTPSFVPVSAQGLKISQPGPNCFHLQEPGVLDITWLHCIWGKCDSRGLVIDWAVDFFLLSFQHPPQQAI